MNLSRLRLPAVAALAVASGCGVALELSGAGLDDGRPRGIVADGGAPIGERDAGPLRHDDGGAELTDAGAAGDAAIDDGARDAGIDPPPGDGGGVGDDDGGGAGDDDDAGEAGDARDAGHDGGYDGGYNAGYDAGPAPAAPLDAFTAEAGDDYGEILLVVDFPADTSRYALVVVRRAQGSTAPSASCDDGDEVARYEGPFVDAWLEDAGLVQLAPYSYRACVYDDASELSSSAVAEGVTTRGCAVVESVVEQPSGLKAAIQDAYWAQWGSGDAWAPHRIFSSEIFAGGDVVTLVSSWGNSICRIYPNGGNVECGPVACPGQWKLFFHDGAGAVMWQAAPDDLAAYAAGVPVPPGATRATIGFRDREPAKCGEAGKCCDTGGNCSTQTTYFDNEGNRSTSSSSSTGGCTFQLRYDVVSCN